MRTRNGVVLTIALSVVASTPLALSLTAEANASTVTAQKTVKTHTVGVGSNPIDVAVSQSMRSAFVINDGSLSIVSLLTHREVAELGTGFHDQTAIALTRKDTKTYIGTFDLPYLTVFDNESRQVTRHIKVGYSAVDIAVAKPKFGERAYVALLQSSRLAVVRTDKAYVTRYVKLPAQPQVVTTVPGNKRVWVGSAISGRIWAVSTKNPKVRKTIKVTQGGPVEGIAFSKSGRTAYVTGLGGVSIVRVSTGKVRKFIPITKLFPNVQNLNIGPIALTGSGKTALVVNSTYPDSPAPGLVRMFNTRTFKLGKLVRMGVEPTGLAIDTKRNTAYVTNYQDDTVTYFKTPK